MFSGQCGYYPRDELHGGLGNVPRAGRESALVLEGFEHHREAKAIGLLAAREESLLGRKKGPVVDQVLNGPVLVHGVSLNDDCLAAPRVTSVGGNTLGKTQVGRGRQLDRPPHKTLAWARMSAISRVV